MNVHIVTKRVHNSSYRWFIQRNNAEYYFLEPISSGSASILINSRDVVLTPDESALVTESSGTRAGRIKIKGSARLSIDVNYVPNDNEVIRRVHPVMPYPNPDENGNP